MLGHGAFTAVAKVQSLVGELRPCKLHGATKINKNSKKQKKRVGRYKTKRMLMTLRHRDS